MDSATPVTQAATNQSLRDHVHAVVRDRQRVLFEGDVKAVTSTNEKGVFDILPEHTNFISIVKDFVTLHKLDGSTQEFKLPVGIVKVIENDIRIYIGIATVMNPQSSPKLPPSNAQRGQPK